MRITKVMCNKGNYDFIGKRSYDKIKGIVIHNTGNKGDTAINNANYFKRENNLQRSAHFFIDRDGYIVQSVRMYRIAWSVGKPLPGVIFNNTNTVSIELCDIVDKDISEKQLESLKWLIKKIMRKCKNARTILRHYDINHKQCPARYVDSKKWNELLRRLSDD